MRCIRRGIVFAFVGLILMTAGFCLAMAGWFTPPVTVGMLPVRLAGTVAFFVGLVVLLGSCFACAIHQRRCCVRCLSSASVNKRPTARGLAKMASAEQNGRMQEARTRNAPPVKQQHRPTPRVGRAERVVQVESHSGGSGRQVTKSEQLSPSDSTVRRSELERDSEISRAVNSQAESVPSTQVLGISRSRRSHDRKQRPLSFGGKKAEDVCVTSAPVEYLYISPGFPDFRYGRKAFGNGKLRSASHPKQLISELPGELIMGKQVSNQVRGLDLDLSTLNYLSGSGSQLRQPVLTIPFENRTDATSDKFIGGQGQSAKTGVQGQIVETRYQGQAATDRGQDRALVTTHQSYGWSKGQSHDVTGQGHRAGRSIFDTITSPDDVQAPALDAGGQGHVQNTAGRTVLENQGLMLTSSQEIGGQGHTLTLARKTVDGIAQQTPAKRCRSCEEKYFLRIVRDDVKEPALPVTTESRRRVVNQATQTPLLGGKRPEWVVRAGERELKKGINVVTSRNIDLIGSERRQGGWDAVGERDFSGIESSSECDPESSRVKYRRVMCPVHDLPQS